MPDGTERLMERDVSQKWASRENLALLTDYYQLTMMGGCWKTGRKSLQACFAYTFRELPPHNGFAIAAGLEQLLDLVENLRFTQQDLDYLSGLGAFDDAFLEYLGDFRPTCSIEAVPEGTVVFPHEPILQVEGPLIEAQLLETAVLNALNYPTLVATKAARIRSACDNDNLVEFGLRRAHGPDGGLSGSRAAYIGGVDSTSNMLAGKAFGIPVTGTHAHSWVMSLTMNRRLPGIHHLLRRPHTARRHLRHLTSAAQRPHRAPDRTPAGRWACDPARFRDLPAEQGRVPHVRSRVPDLLITPRTSGRRSHRRPEAAGSPHQLRGSGNAPDNVV